MKEHFLVEKFVFGLKPKVRSSLLFLGEDHTVVYPCGHVLVFLDYLANKQKFISSTPGKVGITSMCLTNDKSVVAVAEEGDANKKDGPCISTYNTATLQKTQTMSPTQIDSTFESTKIVSMAFSSDAAYLCTLGGKPDWKLLIWNWERSKLLAMTQVSDGPPLYQCSFNNTDSEHICVCGSQGQLKFYRYEDDALKKMLVSMSEFEKLALDATAAAAASGTNTSAATEAAAPTTAPVVCPINYLCHTWLQDMPGYMLVATADGQIALIGDGSFSKVLPTSPKLGTRVNCIAAYSKGFVVGCDNAQVLLYSSAAMDEGYTLELEYTIKSEKRHSVVDIAISSSEGHVACTLSNHQVYKLKLGEADPLKIDGHKFRPLYYLFHGPGPTGESAISGIDTCIRKPYVVTCGKDCSVRVWDYLKGSCELYKFFPEEALSVALHPTGYHLLVGFSDKLRLMNVLDDTLSLFQEFPLKNCRECRFSNGGQLFAATYNTSIHIFRTFTCELVHILRGHNGKVQSLWWAQDDTKLLSAGWGGAIYQWDLKSAKREVEYVRKGNKFSCVISDPQSSTVLAVGSDRKLKNLEFPECKELHDVQMGSMLSQCAAAWTKPAPVLFVGTADSTGLGCVRTIGWPLDDTVIATSSEKPVCGAAVTRMCVSHANNYLFVGGADGTLTVLTIEVGKDDLINTDDGIVPFSDQVLVTRSEMEEKTATIAELEAAVFDLERHNDYKLKLKEMAYTDAIKALTDDYNTKINNEKTRYDELYNSKGELEHKNEKTVGKIQSAQLHELQKLEAEYQQKIMAEVESYQEKKHDVTQLKSTCQLKRSDLVKQHTAYVQEVTHEYDTKLARDRGKREQMEADTDHSNKVNNEWTSQLAEDIDTEIEEMTKEYNKKLSAEKDATLRYKGENGIMRKRFKALTKEIENHKEEIKLKLEKEKQLFEHISSLGTEILGLKHSITEHDDIIAGKEREIYELKKKNQKLEKFKFVLDYKIKELKKQIEPREKEITDMKERIKEIDGELERYHLSNAALDTKIGTLRLQLEKEQQNIARNQIEIGKKEQLTVRFQSDLHSTVQHIQNPKRLDQAMQELYHKYVKLDMNSEGMDETVQDEFDRQRQFLEVSVDLLKQKSAKELQGNVDRNQRLMEENVGLINEIKKLRKDIKTLKLEPLREDTARAKHTSAQPELIRMLEEQSQDLSLLKMQIKEATKRAEALQKHDGVRLPPVGTADTQRTHTGRAQTAGSVAPIQ